MESAKLLIKMIYDGIRGSGEDDKKDVVDYLQVTMAEMAQETSWVGLRQKATLSCTDADENSALLLPANCCGIDGIWDDSGNRYWPADRSEAEGDESLTDQRYRWFYADAVQNPLVYQKGLTINQGANTFTNASPALAWLSDYEGEYITFEGSNGAYLITGEREISPNYFGPGLKGRKFQIRPRGQKRISVVTNSGTFPSTATLTVHYWIYPFPIWSDEDILQLPATPLFHLTVGRMLSVREVKRSAGQYFLDQYFGNSLKGIQSSLSKAKVSNPRFHAQSVPMGTQGTPMGYK